MRVLVTGGAGFIGSHIVEHFQGKAEIRVLDNLRSGHEKNIANFDCEFIKGDICDREVVKKAMVGVDYVFHLAAMISVPESMHNPIECAKLNVGWQTLKTASILGNRNGRQMVRPTVGIASPVTKHFHQPGLTSSNKICSSFHYGLESYAGGLRQHKRSDSQPPSTKQLVPKLTGTMATPHGCALVGSKCCEKAPLINFLGAAARC